MIIGTPDEKRKKDELPPTHFAAMIANRPSTFDATYRGVSNPYENIYAANKPVFIDAWNVTSPTVHNVFDAAHLDLRSSVIEQARAMPISVTSLAVTSSGIKPEKGISVSGLADYASPLNTTLMRAIESHHASNPYSTIVTNDSMSVAIEPRKSNTFSTASSITTIVPQTVMPESVTLRSNLITTEQYSDTDRSLNKVHEELANHSKILNELSHYRDLLGKKEQENEELKEKLREMEADKRGGRVRERQKKVTNTENRLDSIEEGLRKVNRKVKHLSDELLHDPSNWKDSRLR